MTDDDLARRYATRAPRYTSYPTAPNFSEDFDREETLRRWSEAQADLSLYLHIPYCVRRCLFCGCHTTITRNEDRRTRYVDTLLQELGQYRDLTDLSRPLRQLAIGGGTPNTLTQDVMSRLIETLEHDLNIQADAERSIEVDPRILTQSDADHLLRLGFNRISLGVQDLHEPTMTAVNRPQSHETIEALVSALRSRGDVPINFDLIYGLPLQTRESWTRTIERVIALAPARLAVYGYAHFPTLKRHQSPLERHEMPDDALRSTLQQIARDRLGEAGYNVIGFDHYARPEDELALAYRDRTLHRNFMGYTTHKGLDIVAAGVSAIGTMNNTYTQVHKDEGLWREAIADGKPPWVRGMLLNEDDAVRRELIIQLSCNLETDLDALCDNGVTRFAPELDSLKPMFDDECIELVGTRLIVTERGRPFVRNLCAAFDRYLKRQEKGSFSRTS